MEKSGEERRGDWIRMETIFFYFAIYIYTGNGDDGCSMINEYC